ncbi:MAG: hypothetical protein HY906_21295 [Deltaproteobacteria bacterium]|nr:hypothetical protein [Deltaproteobacteria bacterium]
MPRKPSSGDKVVDLTVRILTQIRDEIRTTNSRLDAVRTELKSEIGELRAEMHTGFDLLGKRIDNLLMGEHGRDHAELRERVVRLEERAGIHPGEGR